jgi:formylglycine-generating enzyme required for sulfatase activity
VRAEERQRQRFSELLVQALSDPRLRAMMSMRSDFLGYLQNDEPLFKARQQIDVPPLRETELREVVSSPARLLAARFETESLIDIMTRRAAEDAVKDVGALPLLSYTLDDMWQSMVKRGDGMLRLPVQSFELGGVLVDRADRFLETHPGAEDALRRVLTLRLATVHEDSEPTRRRAARSEFSDKEWRLISELADYPNRLLVTVTAETGEAYAEVAHEAMFRRWRKLRDWIAAEREFLAWRGGLEVVRRAWQAAPDRSKNDALLMGLALAQAQSWLLKRAEDLPAPDREFIAQSIERENQAQARARRIQAAICGLVAAVILGLVGWIEQSFIKDEWLWWTSQRRFVSANIWPYALNAQAEQALKSSDSFRECAPRLNWATVINWTKTDYCPDMVVVPAGTFAMGSLPTDKDAHPPEFPQHQVTIAKPFAVSKFELTAAEWDACVAGGGCSGYEPPRDTTNSPVTNVSKNDAHAYVAWLSQVTGKTYRLLTEAEYEYAARAGTTTEYPWGDDIGTNNAHCAGCGSKWDKAETAPVGSFPANKFGLYDMVGNVMEWVEDCYHPNYQGAPTDGSAWIDETAYCSGHLSVVRGGSSYDTPDRLGSAMRGSAGTDIRTDSLGIRVARTLTP